MNKISTSNASSALSEALGIPDQLDTKSSLSEKMTISIPPISSNDQITKDADYVRENIIEIIQKGSESLDQIMHLATEAMHPRVWEVVGQILKVQSDNVDKLLKLHADKKKLNSVEDGTNSGNGMTVEKAIIFQGTSEDLIRQIRHEAKTTQLIDSDVNTADE